MMIDTINCKQCNGAMRRETKTHRNLPLQLLGVILFFVGIGVAFIIPIFGWVIGAILCVASLGLGYRKKKIWTCNQCGYFFERI